MDWFHVDLILLVILCILTVFLCAYGAYCVYRVLVSLQMQILLRPTRVLFSHKKEGQSREELRTVVAYQNPFTGNYCVHKSRGDVRGYLNTTPSPDSGLSDEYEPLKQPALAHGSACVEQDNQLSADQSVEAANRQSVEPPYYRQSVEPAYYRHNVEPSLRQSFEPTYKLKFEPVYKQDVESEYGLRLEPAYYEQREESAITNIDPVYIQRKESGMTNVDFNTRKQRRPAQTMDLPYHQREKSARMMSTEQTQAGVKLTSTRSLNTSQPLRLGLMTHLKSALRKPRHPLKTSSMPSMEDNVLNKTWNWNYKEYQI